MLSPVKIWRNQKHIAHLLGKTGEIISWTIIRVPPSGFSSFAPYPVVLIALNDGSHLTAQLVDWDGRDIVIGSPVVTVIRRIAEPAGEGIIPYGIKVKLL